MGKTMAEELREWLDDPKTRRMIAREIAALKPYERQFLEPYLRPAGRVRSVAKAESSTTTRPVSRPKSPESPGPVDAPSPASATSGSSTSSLDRVIEKARRQGRGGKKCPNCKGVGHTFVNEWAGNDSYDEPTYRDRLVPCTVCREIVTRVKRKYR